MEIAQDLSSFKFDEHVKKAGLGFRAHHEEDGSWIIEFGQADNKELQAFLFRFRLFIQHNEPISFHNLHNLMADPDISENWKKGVGKAIQDYFDYMNRFPEDIEDLFGKRPTNEEILDTVLYGGLGHTGLDRRYRHKRQRFQNWARDEIRANVLFQVFTRIVLTIFRLINYIADLSDKELEKTAK